MTAVTILLVKSLKNGIAHLALSMSGLRSFINCVFKSKYNDFVHVDHVNTLTPKLSS